MGRSPKSSDNGLKKGPWTAEEDQILMEYIHKHGGHGSWRALPKRAGLNRCGKSCRLRWTNYLRPDIKRGNFSQEEEQIIINLHSALGNKWSQIAAHLPGRTDNEIKNFWNTHHRRKIVKCGIDPKTHQPICDLNFLVNLSHLISLPTPKLSNIMSPLEYYHTALGLKPYTITQPAANIQLLQNLLQFINSTNPLPNIDQETSLSQFHGLIDDTSAPLYAMNSTYQESLNMQISPQRDGENLAVKTSAACIGSEFWPQVVHNNMLPTISENSAVKEMLESSYPTCIPTDIKPAAYNFETLEELMDDFEDETSFWKDIINYAQ